MIVEENPGQLGWGAAIAAILAEEAFADLDGPVLRVSGGNVPLPVAAPLEAEVSVSADRVVAAVSGLLGVRHGQRPPTVFRAPHPAPRRHSQIARVLRSGCRD